MKLLPDNIGGNRKQYAILGGLAVVVLISYFMNRTPSGPPSSTPAPVRPAAQDPAAVKTPAVTRRTPNRAAGARKGEDFKPTLKLAEGLDVTKIDPTIKLALLEKVRNAEVEPGSRGSVFAFGKAPPPPAPKVAPIKPGTETAAAAAAAAAAAEPVKPVDPPPPTAPPVPLKFYGYSNARTGGTKRAFFLDGEDITVVTENDVVKNRYKIIKIGVNSVVVEDMNFKSQQTLPLVEELPG